MTSQDNTPTGEQQYDAPPVPVTGVLSPPQQDVPPPLAEIPSPSLPKGMKQLVYCFLILFCFTLYLFYQVFSPFLHSFLLAAMLSALVYPAYSRLLVLFGHRPVLAASAVVLLLLVLVVVPVAFFIAGLIPQAIKSINAINTWLAGHHLGELVTTYVDPWVAMLNESFPEFDIASVDIRGGMLSASRKAGQLFLSYSTVIAGNTLRIAAHFLFILLFMFYFLLNGMKVMRQIIFFCPLKPEHTTIVIQSMRRMSRSVFVGGLLIAVTQGTVGGIGLAYVGIPGLFWGTVMAFTSLIPVVGTSLVWLPASLFLFLSGETTYAIMLVVWSIAVVGNIDTFLRPMLLREGAPVPMIFLFFSILGGVQAFGMLGILYGPMILGLMAVMLNIYGEEYRTYFANREEE